MTHSADWESLALLREICDAWDDFANDAAGPWERRLDNLVLQAREHLAPRLLDLDGDPAPAPRCIP